MHGERVSLALKSLTRLIGTEAVCLEPRPRVSPASLDQVRKTVQWARRWKIPLIPAGGRTSFWGSTPDNHHPLIDLRRLSRLVGWDRRESVIRVQAGMTFASLASRLAARGQWLPISPDGPGTAAVASLITNDTSAGYGTYSGPAANQVVGLTAVLGTGEILKCGASTVLRGLPPFTRCGMPDLIGPLRGSEGTLAIITELALAVRPLPDIKALELTSPRTRTAIPKLLAVEEKLRFSGVCHDWKNESRTRPDETRTVIRVASPGGPADLEFKLARVRAELRAHGLPLGEVSTSHAWRPSPPPSGLWAGVALTIPYGYRDRLYGLWDSRLRDLIRRELSNDSGMLRVYFGGEGLTGLVSWSHGPGEPALRASAELARTLRVALGPWGVPYRIGQAWRPFIKGRVDKDYLNFFSRLKNLMDPDNILNPGVGLAAQRR